jgi:hypothetical protein
MLGICLFLAPRLIAFWSIVLGVLLYRYGLGLSVNSENAATT